MNVRRFLVALWLFAALMSMLCALYFEQPALHVVTVLLLVCAVYVALVKIDDGSD